VFPSQKATAAQVVLEEKALLSLGFSLDPFFLFYGVCFSGVSSLFPRIPLSVMDLAGGIGFWVINSNHFFLRE